MSIQVRQATLDDVPWILVELRAFARFFGSRKSLFPDDSEYACGLLARLIEDHPFFVAEGRRDRPPVKLGFISGTLSQHPYNPAITVLTETFWWVAPDSRGSRAGAVLLEAFTEYGKQHADWIVMTLEADSPVRPESLERRGFHLHERSFLMETC